MNQNNNFSLLQPAVKSTEYRRLPDNVIHDLGLDAFCEAISGDKTERRLIANVLSQVTDEADVAAYRSQIFVDILHLPELRKTLLELFDKIQVMKDFSTMHKTSDEELGLWHLFHRLDELDGYIRTVGTLRDCLSDERIKSEGLIALREHITALYNEACFAEMEKDIAALKIKASDVQSVTLGINVNERFEAVSIGLVSVNKKPFKKSGIVSNFADAISSKDRIQETSEWDGDMHYQLVEKENNSNVSAFIEKMGGFSAVRNTPFVDGRIRSTVVSTPDGDGTSNSTFYLETVMNKMLGSLVKKLRDTLTKYAEVAIVKATPHI